MFKNNLKGLIPCVIAVCSALYSCTNNDESAIDDGQESQFGEFVNPSKQIVDENLSEFAGILSKVIASNKDVRVFLKNESLKEFDKNTDVLYYLVSDEQIGDKTFRELLVEASSEEQISKIEKNVPLLNIYNVRVDPLEVYPENLDVEDNDIPVAVSMPDSTYLYFNGMREYGLAKGEVPGFNLFVVGLNSRVDAKSIAFANNSRKLNNKGHLRRTIAKNVMFKSANFDGRELNREIRKSAYVTDAYLEALVVQAYKIYNKTDNSLYQKAFQRDYIYYGITPTKQKGPLNNSVSEYLAYIEINPNAYFIIGDGDKEKEDPHLIRSSYTKKKSALSTQDQIDKFWSQGAYNFKFEIIKSTQREAEVVYVPLRPDEIWNFNIKYEKKNATLLKHSKHTYKINPREFTAKSVCLNNLVDLGKWDISKEALTRTVVISEVDGEEDITTENTYQVQKAKSRNFSGDNKVTVGLKINDIVNISTEQNTSVSATNSTTTTQTIKVTTHYKKGSDELGKATIYFYDPIILSNISINSIKQIHLNQLKTYNTGCVTFSIIAKAK